MSWLDGYRAKLHSADDALHCVTSGMGVYIQPGCGEPEVLVRALMRRAPFLRDVEVVHLLTLGCADYVSPELAKHFRHNAFFIGGNVREAVNDGRADYTPIYLSEVEDLFETGAMPIDVALIQVSPPDAHGFCSFGVSVDTTLTASKCATHVIAQINDQMPRTFGDSFIHVNQISSCVEASANLCELPPEFPEFPSPSFQNPQQAMSSLRETVLRNSLALGVRAFIFRDRAHTTRACWRRKRVRRHRTAALR